MAIRSLHLGLILGLQLVQGYLHNGDDSVTFAPDPDLTTSTDLITTYTETDADIFPTQDPQEDLNPTTRRSEDIDRECARRCHEFPANRAQEICLNETYAIIAVCAVGGAFLLSLVLLVVSCCLWRRRRRLYSAPASTDTGRMGVELEPLMVKRASEAPPCDHVEAELPAPIDNGECADGENDALPMPPEDCFPPNVPQLPVM